MPDRLGGIGLFEESVSLARELGDWLTSQAVTDPSDPGVAGRRPIDLASFARHNAELEASYVRRFAPRALAVWDAATARGMSITASRNKFATGNNEAVVSQVLNAIEDLRDRLGREIRGG